MRRYGLHAVVALAGIVACSRFGGDGADDDKVSTIPDAGKAQVDAGSLLAADAADATVSKPAEAFCATQEDAAFCADFEDDDAPRWPGLEGPRGDEHFTHAVGVSPDGRRALAMRIVREVKETKGESFGYQEGAYRVALDLANIQGAELDLEVMCESSDFDFLRFAGFSFEWPGGFRTVSAVAFGHREPVTYDTDEKGTPPSVAGADGVWTHVKIVLTRDDKAFNASVGVSNVEVGIAKLDVKESGGTLSMGFGMYDVSEGNTRPPSAVWLDDIVLTTK